MKPKKIPYGLSDFKRVKTENYYIDKTNFISNIFFGLVFILWS